MKKILFIVLLIPIVLFAEEKESFEISIPEDMIKIETNEDYYKWAKDNGDNLPSITIVQGENKVYNIDLFDKEDVISYEEYIEDELNNEIKDYDINIDVYDSNILSINNINTLVYKTKWDTMESYGYDTYQKVYTFTTKNYLTTVTFTAKTEEEVDSEKYVNVINSFVINDENIEVENNNIKIIIVFALGGATVGFIFSLIVNRKRREK